MPFRNFYPHSSFSPAMLLALLITFTLTLSINPLWAAEPPQGLAYALRATLANHPSIRGQQAEVDAQGYLIASTKALRYPTLSLQVNTLDDEFTQSVVRIQQPLLTFGRVSTSIALAEAGFSVEQINLQKLQRQLIENTAAAYARVAGIKQREQVALANITQHETLYNSIVRREAGQLATSADSQLANSRLIQAYATQARIVGELQVALAELEALTQIPVSSDKPIDPDLLTLPALTEVKRLSLQSSAEIHLKQERLNEVELSVEKEKVANRPTLSFRVEHTFSDSFINTDETRAGLAFESSFEGLGFRSRGRIKSALAKMDAAQYDLDSTIIEVQREIGVLMLNREVQNNLILAQQEAVNALTSTLESFMRQYENGLKSWLEILNLQRELTTLRLELAQMETEYLVLSVRAATLIGNLDEAAGITGVAPL